MAALWLLFAWLVAGFVGAALTARWLRRLWKRGGSSLRTRVVAVVLAGSTIVGLLGTTVGLVKAFGAVGGESIDPSQKARILAEGISEAINCTALGVILWVPCGIALFFLTRVRHRSERKIE